MHILIQKVWGGNTKFCMSDKLWVMLRLLVF